MPDVYLLGKPDEIEALAPDDAPDEIALCLNTGPLDREARLPLYALLAGLLIEEAGGLESLVQAIDADGPYLFLVDEKVCDELARFEDEAVETLLLNWSACAAIEGLQIDQDDLLKFLFELTHLCKIRDQNSDLELYLYHEG